VVELRKKGKSKERMIEEEASSSIGVVRGE
jgi:hypothetical protein